MAKTWTFRGSSMSYCIRQLVAEYGKPSSIPDKKRPFLDMGHDLQAGVERFITRQLRVQWGYLDPWYREAKGATVIPDKRGAIEVPGHVDGVLRILPFQDHPDGIVYSQLVLLEVKAIQERNFDRLKKEGDFLKIYPQYRAQAQTYMNFDRLLATKTPDGQGIIAGPFEETYFVFVNRNTSEMLGGLPIKHPAYTQRDDMILARDEDWPEALETRLRLAVSSLVREDDHIPEECDQAGWCFYCKQTGTGSKDLMRTGRDVTLDLEEDMTHAAPIWALEQAIEDIEELIPEVLGIFEDLKARQINLTGKNLAHWAVTRNRVDEIAQQVALWT